MNRDPDATRMAAFKEGDRAAFRMLFDAYKKKIVNFCYRFCGVRETAEDMAQEVFLRVYRAASTYTPDAKFSTWIFRIAANVCLNELRRPAYRYKTEPVDGWMKESGSGKKGYEPAAPRETSPDMMIEKHEQERIIRESIRKLPERQRVALLLVNEGASYEEISQQTGLSESGVKSLIHRARETLRETLKEFLRE
jgi:RNA polymerase sigma-70 factor (ECF subfamily)